MQTSADSRNCARKSYRLKRNARTAVWLGVAYHSWPPSWPPCGACCCWPAPRIRSKRKTCFRWWCLLLLLLLGWWWWCCCTAKLLCAWCMLCLSAGWAWCLVCFRVRVCVRSDEDVRPRGDRREGATDLLDRKSGRILEPKNGPHISWLCIAQQNYPRNVLSPQKNGSRALPCVEFLPSFQKKNLHVAPAYHAHTFTQLTSARRNAPNRSRAKPRETPQAVYGARAQYTSPPQPSQRISSSTQ